MQLQLDKKADIEVKNKYSKTLLHWAALLRHEAVVQLRLDKEADTGEMPLSPGTFI